MKIQDAGLCICKKTVPLNREAPLKKRPVLHGYQTSNGEMIPCKGIFSPVSLVFTNRRFEDGVLVMITQKIKVA